MSNPVLEARDLSRVYNDGGLEVEVLKELNFALEAATQVAIVGASGSGKSTLLNLLGGLDRPSAGEVLLQGQNLAGLKEAQLCQLRNQSLGFVYQFHHLLPEFSALENVAMPMLIAGNPNEQANSHAESLLGQMGLSRRLSHRPAQLSGGERQRVAIARALVMKPAVVLMDEPTGNLDASAAQQVLELIAELRSSATASFVLVTHDHGIAQRMDACYELQAGRLDLL